MVSLIRYKRLAKPRSQDMGGEEEIKAAWYLLHVYALTTPIKPCRGFVNNCKLSVIQSSILKSVKYIPTMEPHNLCDINGFDLMSAVSYFPLCLNVHDLGVEAIAG